MSDSGQTGVHQGRSVNDMMAEYTDRLQKENTELRARAGRLEERLKAVLDSIDPYFENDEYMDCLKVLNETPQQATEQEKTNDVP